MLDQPSPRRTQAVRLCDVDPKVLMRAARRLAQETGSDRERMDLLALALEPERATSTFYVAPFGPADAERLLTSEAAARIACEPGNGVCDKSPTLPTDPEIGL